MKLGKVKWFGTSNYYGERKNDYGFLQSFDGKEDIFFHRTSIAEGSAFFEKNQENQFVIYQTDVSPKNGKKMATYVKLLKEAKEKQKTAIMEQENLINFLPHLNNDIIKKMFLKRCKQLPIEILKEELKDVLMENSLQQLFVTEVPDLYFTKDPKSYFEIMFQKAYFTSEIQQKETIKKLFFENYKAQNFQRSVIAAFREWFQEKMEKSSFFFQMLDVLREDIWEKIDWQQETAEELMGFLEQLKEQQISSGMVERILKERTELLFLYPNFCQKLSKQDFSFLQEKCMIETKEQLQFFMEHLPNPVKEYVLEQTDASLLLSVPECLQNLSDWKMTEIIKQIDFHNTESSYLKKYENVLQILEADIHENAALEIAISMRQKNVPFQMKWWELLNDSVKIRILIYSSNFPEERKQWFFPLKEIYPYEQQKGNYLLQAVLKIFVNLYHSSENSQKKQENFLEADTYLMEYITKCFSTGLDVTHGLNTLLEKCYQGYSSRMYFCDARINRKGNNIFCPEGFERPRNRWGRQGRQVCSYFTGTDLTITKYKKSKDYKHQYLMDLISNVGFWPDLASLSIAEVTEYSFRISAYVNRLIDMRPHTKCSKCNKHFYPQFEYAKQKIAKLPMNTYYCPEVTFDAPSLHHDSNIYLNYCYHCKQIIDSRECKIKDGGKYSQWLCMRCGGTSRILPGKKCPSCGNTDDSLLELSGLHNIICKKCNYDSRSFRSKFEEDFYPQDYYFIPTSQ